MTKRGRPLKSLNSLLGYLLRPNLLNSVFCSSITVKDATSFNSNSTIDKGLNQAY